MRTSLLACWLCILGWCAGAYGADPATGPLRVHPDNPRYFTDGTKEVDGSFRAVYLTGAHTWNNLVDMDRDDPPKPFDFDAYLDFLVRHHHNFIRMWAWDSTVWDTRANAPLGKDFVHHAAPLPWPRTGPGNAPDGKPKFDLTKFNEDYFKRLRTRVDAAGKRGIYVSVMLFEGWGMLHGNQGRAAPAGWAWRSHPFHPDNNVNDLGLDAAKGQVHRLGNQRVNDLQAAYIRKVVDTVNGFDNVLYEVINEGGQKDWDWWVVKTIKDHEESKPKRHPVGITGHGTERLTSMLASPADWISPGRADGYAEDPPAWDAKHKKVSLLDTDHIWGVGGNVGWVWKSFCRGHNPLFMDPYDGSVLGKPGDKQWEPIYRAMGDTRRYAERMSLAKTSPQNELASSKYCLAAPGSAYLVYVPDGGSVTVDLSAAKEELSAEWFDTAQRKAVPAPATTGGARREFKAPFKGAAVLYIHSKSEAKQGLGPLRVHPDNPRYFTDGGGKAIYLTGSHHWHNLQDAGRIGGSPLPKFDYDGYLQLLNTHHHNFIRLWAWEGAGWWWQGGAKGEYYEPLPHRRTGPGDATDGKPKFDLSQFDENYFKRLRSRVEAARDKGIYVSIMLFQGWSIYSHDYGNPWPLHPFNAANNVNGIDGDKDKDGAGKEVHSLDVPAVTRLQEAYLRKVVDTVNDLDNILYEVTNETANHSKEWQYHVIRYVKAYEKTKPKQHPAGMTYFDSGPRGTMEALLQSPADWISPGDDGGRFDFAGDPPAADGRKVSIADTDHIYGVGGDATWVWKTFTRGHNPIYMDPLGITKGFKVSDAQLEGARKAMGQTRRFAERMDLAAVKPENDLASTKYCLANPGVEYLVFLAKGGDVTVDLAPATGEMSVEWFDVEKDKTAAGESVKGGVKRELKAPFTGASVLYLKSVSPKPAARGPLRVHPDNGRYFTDGTKTADGRLRAVYLTGSHTWPNLIDRGPTNPPAAFDFDWYLRLLEKHDHNFIRLWSRHVTWYHDYGDDRVLHAAPLAWQRTGPGNALDGKAKFDLSRLNEAYFGRLRSRVTAARDRGIYVGVMLFGGSYECKAGWRGNPFNAANNVNGIDGDPNRDGNGLETHTLDAPADIKRVQEAYVRKVIDTVNDLDNVLFEISNESDGSSKAWQRHLIKFIKEYEASKPKQHPVGMTALMDNDNDALYGSDAEWVSPSTGSPEGLRDLPPADGRKVSLLDSDHWFIHPILKNPTFGRDWVWQAFCNGHNTLLMENLPLDSGSEVPVTTEDPGHAASRTAMGHTRRFAERMKLAAMMPRPKLSSTGYCLAAPGNEYLVYQPKSDASFTLELAPAMYDVEWFDPRNGETVTKERRKAAGAIEFSPPFSGPAVLYLRKR